MDVNSTKSGSLDSKLEFRWKGTFLEVVDKECMESLSPRASSDPGSHCESDQTYFGAQKEYASCLQHRMSHSWTSDEEVASSLCAKKKVSMAEASSDQDATTCDDGASQTQESSSICDFEVASSRKYRHSTFSEMDQFPNHHERILQYRRQLKVYMQNNALEGSRTSKAQHLSTALESIKEIPEQVAEALEEATTKAVDLIQNEVSVAHNMMVGNELTTNQKAVESLSAISDIICSSLESSVAKAVCNLRVKVHDMVQRLPTFDEQDEEIVRQILTIPQEVGQITRAAVEEASCSSQVHVEFDHILNISASEHIQEAVSKVQKDLIAKAQDAVDIQIDNATSIVKQNEQAAVTVNGALAESLLRAKAAVTAQDGQVPHSLSSSNPGTKGHPEFCARPCMYFALGKCMHGTNCGFCHGSHPRREPHLDKIHRAMLTSMDAPMRCNIILAIVVPKLVELEIGNQDTDYLIQMLAQDKVIHDQAMRKIQGSSGKSLQRALKTMKIRPLLSLIRAPEDSTLHCLVSMLLNVLSQMAS